MNTLKERLKYSLSQKEELSQVGLAKACEIKPPSVSDWLSGKTKRMEGANLLMAANYLGVNPWWLATGKGPRTSDAKNNYTLTRENESSDKNDEHISWPLSITYDQYMKIDPFDRVGFDAKIKRLDKDIKTAYEEQKNKKSSESAKGLGKTRPG